MNNLLKLKNVKFIFLNEKELEKKKGLKVVGEMATANLNLILSRIKKKGLKKVYYSITNIDERHELWKFFE